MSQSCMDDAAQIEKSSDAMCHIGATWTSCVTHSRWGPFWHEIESAEFCPLLRTIYFIHTNITFVRGIVWAPGCCWGLSSRDKTILVCFCWLYGCCDRPNDFDAFFHFFFRFRPFWSRVSLWQILFSRPKFQTHSGRNVVLGMFSVCVQDESSPNRLHTFDLTKFCRSNQFNWWWVGNQSKLWCAASLWFIWFGGAAPPKNGVRCGICGKPTFGGSWDWLAPLFFMIWLLQAPLISVKVGSVYFLKK